MKSSYLLMGVIFFLSAAFYSCAPSDAELQTSINEKLQSDPIFTGITATVTEGTATLSGEVPGKEVRANAANMVKDVEGVLSVTNHITIAPPKVTPSQSLIRDDQMLEDVEAILKDYPGVTATVSGGTVKLRGTIDSSKMIDVLHALDRLHPESIDNQLTVE